MDSATFFWAILAMLLAGMHIFMNKIVAHEKRDAAVNGLFSYGVPALFGAIMLVWSGIPSDWFYISLIAAVAGGSHAIGSMFRITALKYIDTAIFFPIYKIIQPTVIIAAGVIWFHEVLSPLQWFGIICGMSVPLMLINRTENTRQLDLRKGLTFLMVTVGFTALGIALSKIGAESENLIFFLFASQFVGALISVPLIIKNTEHIRHALHPKGRDVFLGVLTGLFQFLSFYALLVAFSTGYLSIVFTIHAHYILIPIFLSVWFYKEHMDLRKFAAVVLSVVAIGLLY
jgi:drug/metabolite transporter (DMT)-like permease